MDSAELALFTFRLAREENLSRAELRASLRHAMPEVGNAGVDLITDLLIDPQHVSRLRDRLCIGDAGNLLGGNRWGAPKSG